MTPKETRSPRGRSLLNTRFAVALLATTALGGTLAFADDDFFFFQPGNLLLSKAVYDAPSSSIAVGAVLPPNCTTASAAASKTPCVDAINDGTYPTVFNNATVDGSFGVTAKIVLDELRSDKDGDLVHSLVVPNNTTVGANKDQMVTSFSSKSEIAMNLSLDRRSVSFMGYLAPIGAIDVSNSNTLGVVDQTNPVTSSVYRVVANLDQFGRFTFTETNAYSGNNGRAAILNPRAVPPVYYMTGNAGNGGKPEPVGIIEGAGAQIVNASHLPEAQQIVGQPTPLGSFNITEVPANTTTDKIGKDTNFRGLRVFHDVIYTTKGSGGNGINTVYFIDNSGNAANGNPKACPNGSGVPAPGATLPTTPINISDPAAASIQAQGVLPLNMCILNGFPTVLAASTAAPPAPQPMFPFGVWFANDHTLYVTDEGNGTATYDVPSNTFTAAAAQTTAGLQKWVFNDSTGTWNLAYTLSAGLNLGVPYTVAGYPTGINPASITKKVPMGATWSPATDGLRNLTGRVNHDGTVTIWAITSTVSGSGDQGADPNKLVMITDNVKATTLPANESFKTVRTAAFGEALRGISFTPGTGENVEEEISSLLCEFGLCRHDH